MNIIVVKMLPVLCLVLNAVSLTQSHNERLLTSYLPASMQALAYYIDQLQYEPLSTATVEPPFNANATSSSSGSEAEYTATTTKRPSSSWNAPSWWQQTTSTTTTPSYIEVPLLMTTKRPSNGWQAPSWWKPTTSSTSTTTNTPRETTNAPATSTTSRPYGAAVWWQPPGWWSANNTLSRTTTTEAAETTSSHAPGIYAPLPYEEQRLPEGYEIFCKFEASDTETLAELPSALIRDIRTETEHDDFTNDVESLDNFLRLYDDHYGRDKFSNVDSVLDRWSSTSTAGKKRVPPNKPYVEFLLVYDLLKRDAKAENLSKYEGYSDEILQQLHELSAASAPRQLYTLFKRMLDRRDIQRSDVVSRIQMLIKELGNSQSPTSKALQPIPPLQFLM